MSKTRHMLNAGKIALRASVVIMLLAGAGTLASCVKEGLKYEETDWEGMHPASRKDPLPGDLVQQKISDDSIKLVKSAEVKRNMAQVIRDYQKRFKGDHFNGYFVTDLNEDGMPELWVRVGQYRENSKLELYYPQEDGTLQRSDTPAQPGQYYLGDDYVIQVVGSSPGYININKISIHNGSMAVENVRELDLYSDPNITLPQFKEREIRSSSLANLNALYGAFNK